MLRHDRINHGDTRRAEDKEVVKNGEFRYNGGGKVGLSDIYMLVLWCEGSSHSLAKVFGVFIVVHGAE